MDFFKIKTKVRSVFSEFSYSDSAVFLFPANSV